MVSYTLSFPDSIGESSDAIGSGLGACSVLDTEVKPDNDKLMRYRQTLNKNIRSTTMKRRDFLRIFLLGGLLSLFSKKAKAEKKPEKPLKEAMFWKRVD